MPDAPFQTVEDERRVTSLEADESLSSARRDVISIHEMSGEVKALLASEAGIFTTTEPRDPGGLLSFLNAQVVARHFKKIEKRINALVAGKSGFTEGELGQQLFDTFQAVTEVSAGNVQDKDGMAVAETMVFTVSNKQEAQRLSFVLQRFLQGKRDPRVNQYVETEDEGGVIRSRSLI